MYEIVKESETVVNEGFRIPNLMYTVRHQREDESRLNAVEIKFLSVVKPYLTEFPTRGFEHTQGQCKR